SGEVLPGLYAAGEAAGFGGGGVHGYRALEGTIPPAPTSARAVCRALTLVHVRSCSLCMQGKHDVKVAS
ncbi:hypothetical protein ACWEIJ_38445, partial [Lentzea sp. NPDC004789]